jgi:hypothetical protein
MNFGTYVVACLSMCFAFGPSASAQQAAGIGSWRENAAKTITLYSRAKYKEQFVGYGKSTFSFKYALRSDDVDQAVTRNDYELQYGGMNINGDSDWFGVTMVTDDCSRIKDLGEQTWAEIVNVPLLPASVEPQRGVSLSFQTRNFEESSNGQVTRVAEGHMYVVHSKDTDSDFYTLFRVDKLVPSDSVTISWKNVPSPF